MGPPGQERNRRLLALILAWSLLPAGASRASEEDVVQRYLERIGNQCEQALSTADTDLDLELVVEELVDAARECVTETQSAACSGSFEHCLGRILHRRAESILSARSEEETREPVAEPDGEARQLLDKAVHHYYLSYLGFDRTPGGALALSSALQLRGSACEAAAVLEDYARAGSRGRADFFLAAGDQWARCGQHLAARSEEPGVGLWRKVSLEVGADRTLTSQRQSFQAATRLQPLNETAWQRLLRAPALKDRRLLSESKTLLSQGMVYAARLGLERLIHDTYRGKEKLVDRGLVYWVQAVARIGGTSEETLQRLPAPSEWDSRGLRDLRNLLEDPAEASLGWWLTKESGGETAEKRLALALLLLDVASTRAANGPPPASPPTQRQPKEMHWLYYLLYPGLPTIGVEEVDFILHRVVALAAVPGEPHTELAMARLEALRRLGERERAVQKGTPDKAIDRLLEASDRLMDAPWLQAEYLEVAGRLVLGLDDPRAAELLHRSLSAAERIGPEDPGYQSPRPSLHQTLAKLGRCPDGSEEVAAHWLDAAVGFLELDATRPAERVLQQLEESGRYSDLLPPLRETIDAMRALARVENLAELKGLAGGEDCVLPDLNPLTEVYPDSTRRLQFKLFSDAGSALSRLGYPRESLRCHSRAVAVLRELRALANPEDLRRVEASIEGLSSLGPTINTTEAVLFRGRFGVLLSRYEDNTLPFPSPSGPSSLWVGIAEDVFRVQKIRQRLQEQDLRLDHPVHVTLDDPSSYFFPGCDPGGAEELRKAVADNVFAVPWIVHGLGLRDARGFRYPDPDAGLQSLEKLPTFEELCSPLKWPFAERLFE